MWTIEEIKDSYEDKYGNLDVFNNIMDETGKYLSQYKDDDEFYTNFEKFYPKDYAESLYEHTKALAYIEDRDFRPDLQEYCEQEVFTSLWLGFDYPQDYFKEAVKAFVFEDYDDYMDYIMEAE